MVLVQKWPFFEFCFLANIAQENVFYYILEEKTPVYTIKTGSSTSRKINIFPKGLTYRFGPKMAIFPTSFFIANISQKNVFYDILKR